VAYNNVVTIRYQTGIAALIQFITMTVLNFVNGTVSSVQECTTANNDCLGGIILNLLFFLLITFWFAFLSVMGYAAQDRRSKRVAQILMGAEILVALVALFDAKHAPDLLGLLTSLVDAALAIWVAFLAFRLVRANGGRVVTTSTGRHRKTVKTQD